jgi:hypothetical protein
MATGDPAGSGFTTKVIPQSLEEGELGTKLHGFADDGVSAPAGVHEKVTDPVGWVGVDEVSVTVELQLMLEPATKGKVAAQLIPVIVGFCACPAAVERVKNESPTMRVLRTTVNLLLRK